MREKKNETLEESPPTDVDDFSGVGLCFLVYID